MERYEDSQLYRIRHCAAHIMAQAVMEMFPGEARIAIGPPIENGFYYDFELPRSLTPEDLEVIEKRMREIIKANQPFVREEVSADQAKAEFADQPYKIELIDGLEKGGFDEYGNPLKEKPVISFYRDGAFVDLCRGPHVESTGKINPKAFKLMSVAGAYWRGDEKNKMLQRIYGTAWESADDLKGYLDRLEEAKKRDHRKLGKELGLFFFSEDVGPGLPLFTPKGEILRYVMERLRPRSADALRLSARLDGPPGQGRPVQTIGPLRQLPRCDVPADGGRRHHVAPQADELPQPHDAVQRDGAALVPRTAAALLGIRHALSLREARRVERPDARARVDAGRLPHLLHARSDRAGILAGAEV